MYTFSQQEAHVAIVNRNLIYDVGLHKGEDTDFYLRKGFQVVGIEANPKLVANAAIRFQDAIARGRLRVIHGAVGFASAGDKIIFYTNTRNTVWGTIEEKWALRNERRGYPSTRTEVDRIDIADVFRSHGIPFYLKIDIEGADRLVLEELKAFQDRPQYVSLESEMTDFNQLMVEMDLLKGLGYTKFKVVQQKTIPGSKISTCTLDGRPFEYEFGPDASGPFGDDLPPPWLSYDEALEQYKTVFRHYRYFGIDSPISRMPIRVQKLISKLYCMSTGFEGTVIDSWYDTHASL